MRKKLEALNDIDIKYLKEDIAKLEKNKGTFLTIGFVLLGLSILGIIGTILLAIGVYNDLKNGDSSAAYFLFVLFDSLVGSLTLLLIIGTVTMFVLRGTLLDKKIAKRQRVIDEYNELHKDDHE